MNSNQPTRKKRRKLRGYHILIGLLLIGVGWFAAFRWRVRSELQARIDAIRAAGYPVTCEELNEWYIIPGGAENAADVILRAISYHRGVNETERGLLPIVGRAQQAGRTESLSEETREALGRYLADNQETLGLLHEAAAIEHSRYPVNFAAGMNATIPDLHSIKSMARLLTLDAVWRAENDEAASAVESVVSVFAVARSLSQEPMTISQLVRIASLSLAALAVERVINRVELTDEQLAELGDAILRAEDFSGLPRAFAGERCQVFSVFREPESLPREFYDVDEYLRLHPAALQVQKALGLLDRSAIVHLDLMAGYMEAVQRPEHDRVAGGKAIEAEADTACQGQALLRCLMPAFSRVITIDLRRTAHLRAVRVGLAIERYRLDEGRLPDTLDELVPAYLDTVPKDPFDGKELRYKRLETGYVVYSIGEDGTDDGGKEIKRGKGAENWDVTFIVER